ncbi:hypothetical protein JW964_26585 [candidate division KSB1 bacterium]|nr:hypothetical protein [candidate division KSB1 bacterium]
MLLIPFLIITITVYIFSFFVKPVYESSTSLMINGEQLINRDMATLMPGVTPRQQTANIIKSKVLSRINLIDLINRMKMKEDAELQEQAREKQKSLPGYALDEILHEILLERLQKIILVQNVGMDYITITCQHNKPEKAYLMASNLTEIFIQNSIKTQMGGLEGVVEFGEDQLEIYYKKLKEAEQRLSEYEQRILNRQVENFNISSIDLNRLNATQMETEMRIDEIQEQLNTINSQIDITTNEYKIEYTPYIQLQKKKLFEKADELAKLLTQYDWKDTKVIRMNNEIIGLKGGIGQELTRICREQGTDENQINLIVRKELIEIELDTYLRQKGQLDNKLKLYKQNVASDPTNDLTRKRLEDELTSYREIYLKLMQQKSGTQMQQALKQKEAQVQYEIVEPAFRPLKPVKPNRVRFILMGAFVGLAVGMMIVFVQEYIDDSFKDVNDVENYLGIVVLGTIPKINMEVPKRVWKNKLKLKSLVATILNLSGLLIYFFKR